LSMNGECNQTLITNFIGSTKMNTSKTLVKLARKGFISKSPAKDIRSNSIVLTDAGKSKLLETVDAIGLAHSKFFPAQNHTDLTQILTDIITNQN
jgi:DNA-binding MarR family transcriptional regulator